MRCYSGSYTGNGSDNRNITGVPFQPAFVMVFRTYGTQASGNQSGGSWRNSADSGDNSRDLYSGWNFGGTWNNMIQQFNSDGFQVGNDGSGPNVSGNYYEYLALEADSDCLYSGYYDGNSSSPRVITPTSLGFDIKAIIIGRGSGSSGSAHWVTKTRVGDAADSCFAFNSVGYPVANIVTTIGTTTFTVGIVANFTGSRYYYTLLGNKTGNFYESKFAGNSTDDRNIVMGDPFQPEAVICRGTSTAVANSCGTVRRQSITSTGDLSWVGPIPSGTYSYQANMIQALNSNGFQVGTANTINKTGDNFYYMAFGNPVTAVPVSAPTPFPIPGSTGSSLLPFNAYGKYKGSRQVANIYNNLLLRP